MISPKSPEEILTEALPQYKHFHGGLSTPSEMQGFLRSSLASVLLWASEQMPPNLLPIELPYDEDTFEHGRNNAITDCRSLLIEKAKEITKE